MKKVSVIMPLYNVENCMGKSVQSVLDQTYSDFELILVDDGSPDRSGQIAEEFKEKFPDKIRVIHQQNAGLGGARNTGVKYAEGKYLLFVDSDDTIAPNLLELCVAAGEESDAEIVAFEYDMRTEAGELIKTVKSPFNFPKNGDIRTDRKFLLLQSMAWNKLFLAEFYHSSGLEFPEHVWYEDLIFCTKLMSGAKRIVYLDQPLYRYSLRAGSIMRNANIDRNREIMSAMDDVLSFFRENGLQQQYYDELCYLAIDNIYIAASLRLIRMDRHNSMIDEFHEYLKKNFPDYRSNPYISSMAAQYRLTYWLLEHKMKWMILLLIRIKDRKK